MISMRVNVFTKKGVLWNLRYSGGGSIECKADGSWTSLPSCQQSSTCGKLDVPNGGYEGTGSAVGTTFDVQCNAGYSGSGRTTCEGSSMTWTPTRQCVKCPARQASARGAPACVCDTLFYNVTERRLRCVRDGGEYDEAFGATYQSIAKVEVCEAVDTASVKVGGENCIKPSPGGGEPVLLPGYGVSAKARATLLTLNGTTASASQRRALKQAAMLVAVFACPGGTQTCVNGNVHGLVPVCAVGHTGPLCAHCQESAGYSRKGLSGGCLLCAGDKLPILPTLLMVLCLSGLSFLIYRFIHGDRPADHQVNCVLSFGGLLGCVKSGCKPRFCSESVKLKLLRVNFKCDSKPHAFAGSRQGGFAFAETLKGLIVDQVGWQSTAVYLDRDALAGVCPFALMPGVAPDMFTDELLHGLDHVHPTSSRNSGTG